MSDYSLKDITEEEKAQVFELATLLPISPITLQVLAREAKGVTLYKDDVPQGAVMILHDRLLGAKIGGNNWIPGWPLLINWVHSQQETITMSVADEKTASLLVKIGAISKIYESNVYIVTFEKAHTEQILQTFDLFKDTLETI